MEDPSGPRQNLPGKGRHRPSPTTTISTTTTGDSDGEVEAAVQGDPKAWAAFSKSFRQVQSVLDRNRLLIQQVNENHQSRIPDSMLKNVSLIQELNGNISKKNESKAMHTPLEPLHITSYCGTCNLPKHYTLSWHARFGCFHLC